MYSFGFRCVDITDLRMLEGGKIRGILLHRTFLYLSIHVMVTGVFEI